MQRFERSKGETASVRIANCHELTRCEGEEWTAWVSGEGLCEGNL